jgi:HSP20 family protein
LSPPAKRPISAPTGTALHLENVQRDYQLKLRLGSGFNFPALQASISRGVLTIVLPKTPPTSAARPARQRQVA